MDERFLCNNKVLKGRRKEFRNNPTPAEKLLWKHINKDKILGMRFLRQYGVGPYILDFYCSKIRLGIEVDGEIHKGKENKFFDKEREGYLNAFFL